MTASGTAGIAGKGASAGRDAAALPRSGWGAVFALTLCVAALIASEFMPVSLLTPIAGDLGITEGRAGPAIAVSGVFAVLTSLGISTVSRGLGVLLGLLALGGCEPREAAPSPSPAAADPAPPTPRAEEPRMWMTVGERHFAITLSDNAAARELAARLPLTLDMGELNGNEKHAELPEALPANASRPGTIRNGDLMLYGTNTVVLFYETFSSSYSYTRLGRVDDPAELPRALGRRGARVAFSKD